jgi:hypothetical protein
VADLIPRPSGRGGERGQLLLIAAFIVAVSFVALALVVNSAIFTENLATRDDVAGSEDALEHRHEVEQSVEETINEINQNNTILDDYSTANLDTPVRENVERIARQTGLQQSAQGRVVDIEYLGWVQGIKVAQDDQRTFTNESGEQDWLVMDTVSDTRRMRFNLTTPPSVDLTSSPFEMDVYDGVNEWSLRIAEDSVISGDVVVEVDRPGEPPETCTSEFDGFLVIDVTAGTIGGEPCHALTRLTDGTPMWFASGVGPGYEIEFNNGHRIEGTYSFVVDAGALEGDSRNFGSPGSGPYTKDAVYSATVLYQYHTEDVGYETPVQVVPGRLPP